MKNLIFLILPLLFVISCNEEKVEEELEPIDKDSLYGKWQLVEEWDGVMSDPYEVEDGYYRTFNSDSTCSVSWSFKDCDNVKCAFKLSSDSTSDIMEVAFTCQDNGETEIVSGFYRYELEDGFLKLTPHEDYHTCDEGCWERFKKVANEEK
ncbi:hypothetical protein [Marivirga harenae]|uniref:hypothetical protein n=1 Tax=Marivirga harenae TaxID=2010992 RepID=UPI0026DFE44C|nr:hypothetical protein [Marivirga harenae]WKV11713.1 hypothetical protein Q3Y49_16040 [Marivirga harenae]